MAKPQVVEQRFDFRGGRNTAISPDLLNPNELVDCTNARISSVYGGFAKRSGSQRMHTAAFPGAIRGVTQWDTLSGKQTVVISNGDLYYRNGFDLTVAFAKAASSSVARTTANQGSTAGWVDPDGSDDGMNILTVAVGASATVAAANRLVNKLGDPAVDNNVDAIDDLYTLTFKLTADGTGLSTSDPTADISVGVTATLEYSTDNGATWAPLTGTYGTWASIGTVRSVVYSPTVMISGAPAHVWIRIILSTNLLNFIGTITGNGVGTAQIFNTVYKTDNYPVTWTTGAARFSTTQPAIFAEFRASTPGAPLVLYIASGGHYFSWDGVSTLTQLDPTNSAPSATGIISYHTRMFAMTASDSTPGLLPKTIFWSVIGDATDFRTGDKSKGGSAVTDFLTGQELVALEVIGSSLLMTTRDSVMRFTGHASDDIVISQDTEGISAEVGAVGPLALKRFENVAAMMTERGPYVVTETYAEPMGEQLNPDWQALNQQHLLDTSIEYNRSKKELLFAVHGANDGPTSHKTVFSQAVRLQSWQGPWVYPFGITCMSKYFANASEAPTVIVGCDDGFIRLMDVGTLDDVLADGSGGVNISMTVEIPVMHFGLPGLKKALKWLILQGDLPIGSSPTVKISFDGSAFTSFPIVPNDNGEEDYRVDIAGDSSQGFRVRLQFTDSSPLGLTINGFTLIGWNMQRTT